VEHPAGVALNEGLVEVGDSLRELCGALRPGILSAQFPARHQRAILIEDDAGTDQVRVDEQISHALPRVASSGPKRIQSPRVLDLDDRNEDRGTDHE